MSDIIREQAQWRREKVPIISKYVEDHSNLLSVIAGRGFLILPGYAYDLINGLELIVKNGLSEINYKILSDTITRELKSLGIDYDLAYKDAAIIWVIEKQTLLSDWDKEYALIKQGMANTEESLNRIEIAVQVRTSIIIAAKTAIEIEVEGYKRQIAELIDDTADYEVILAGKKVLTANKKLEILPILIQIAAAETRLIEDERNKLREEGILINALEGVAEKKRELIPLFADLITQMILLSSAIERQTGFLNQIAAKKVEIAGVELEKAMEHLNRATTLTEIENLQTKIASLKSDIETIRLDAEKDVLSKDASNVRELSRINEVNADSILYGARAANQVYISSKALSISNDLSSKVTANGDTVLSDEARIKAEALARNLTITEKAKIEAITQVTATLSHLLSM